jgi:hypothetical protein
VLHVVWVHLPSTATWKLSGASSDRASAVLMYFWAMKFGYNARLGALEPAWTVEEILAREG